MAVEQLAVVGGPLAGLGNPTGVVSWMQSHGIQPVWVGAGAIAGAFLGDQAARGALKGAALAALLSWAYTRFLR